MDKRKTISGTAQAESLTAERRPGASGDGRKGIGPGRLIRACAFLLTATLLFHYLTLVYDRPVSYRLAAYRSLPKDSVDAVSIGASTVYRFFNPMEGWEKFGISSYAFGYAGMDCEHTIFAVEDVLKTQKPKVILLEVRGFLGSRTKTGMTASTYRVIKNYRNPLDRWRILNHFNRIMGQRFSADQIPYYLTLVMNHENYWTLIKPGNWKKALRADNSIFSGGRENTFMGYSAGGKVTPLTRLPYDKNRIDPLGQVGEKALREVLDKCREKNQEVMLVASPFAYSEEDIGQLNRVAQIAEEYGISFLNTNERTDQMGIDYGTDFADPKHTNVLGAIKYTDYIYSYLKDRYALADHRGESGYQNWEQEDLRYQTRKDQAIASIREILSGAEGADSLVQEDESLWE